ncbi:MAG: hypothetical protein MPEBLZ_02727 [Candidatus Methanoperedens nitroreducens]|uniref:Uncharacterized protein n=1 Tax=Candidatus Methanoperedens nitratireducens TaxID=1392998 RepID=A0A0P8C7G9_9EURY|nr:hypothetical protein [Candidatus Methanoperedens sp. BLZ2]KAB2947703.1 MAG: hypothetical protein F9K14_02510 [Candidatus Methanoperedens sp.]KPQ42710.1 MAG: hypothetical protein MPEBLZ_02727 [Candidatus Methanoperedens sp. BLZ1]MBZ0176235.1 hypothetical protein [Candidatus Methanoperedens nitroreducens]CAG1004915.1 hypothetical protein METP1_03195 [Methanosarcinales archaeon]MCX9026633.1 hypothetical protein [Candidatus Methanoperedens sp.]
MKRIVSIIFFIIILSSPVLGAYPDVYFTKISIDGVNTDSNGLKLLLRASERHSGAHFQPYVVNVNFILIDHEKTIFSEKVRQVSVGETIGGTAEIVQPWYVSLEEGKNYTALAEIYLVENGKVDYLTTASANFTAIMDAKIEDIYGDSIGASATVKGESMVPLDAKIIFTLKQDGIVLEIREAKAPYIMSNDQEKTVDVLWSKSLQPGEYVIATELRGDDTIARYDKAITVDKKQIPVTPATPTPAAPGFQLYFAVGALLVIILARRNMK